MPDLAFPPMGRLGLTSPPSQVLCSATTALCPSRCPVLSLVHRYLVWFVSSLGCKLVKRVERPPHAWPAWSPGTPFPGCLQGNNWLSQVPRLPLCWHAPLSDPGGVLSTRPSALRTTAFRLRHHVGFLVSFLTIIIHNSTNFEALSRGLLACSPWLRTSVTGLTRRVHYYPVG